MNILIKLMSVVSLVLAPWFLTVSRPWLRDESVTSWIVGIVQSLFG
jgi:hypothetical protein